MLWRGIHGIQSIHGHLYLVHLVIRYSGMIFGNLSSY